MCKERRLPFKPLTPANWRDPDPVNASFARVSPLVGVVQMDGDAWARAFLVVELKEHVPEDIRDLFAAARGALVYGWFFYPLFVLGEAQIHRVAEAAVRSRYRQIHGPKRSPSFAQGVDWLIKRDVIPAEDRPRWDAVRQLRNAASHPSRHSALPPGHVLRVVEATAHDINRLFARPPRGGPTSG